MQRFAPPKILCAEAAKQWDAFWSDPVAQAPTGVDRAVVMRWIENVNRYYISVRAADEEPVVEGSTGQKVVNPLYKVAEMALAAAERAERQLGIGAKHRADLGIAIVAGKKSLAELNKDFEESGGDEDSSAGSESEGDGESSDPRLQVVRGEVVPPKKSPSKRTRKG